MKCRPNIVLIGLMGTGKTSVGRRLACELGVDFLDLDELIEKEAGMPIKDIFAGAGEAHFRVLEAEAVKRVTTEMDSMVLSVGGGAVIDAANRRALRGWGKVVCLKASVETILERVGGGGVGGDDVRPLLNDGDQRESISRLFEEREPFYNDSDLVVDTDSIRVGKVVEVIKCFLSRPGRR